MRAGAVELVVKRAMPMQHAIKDIGRDPPSRKTGDINSTVIGEIMITSDIKAGDKTPSIGLGFVFARNHWVYFNCHDVNFLVDGKPWQPESVKFQNQMEKSAAVEVVTATLTRAQVQELAAASRVEYRICRDEFAFDNAMMQNFKDFGPAYDKVVSGELQAPGGGAQ